MCVNTLSSGRAWHLSVRSACVLTAVLLAAAPATSQTRRPFWLAPAEPKVSIRGYGMIAEQQFAAQTTFDGIFGTTVEPFWGGGGEVAFRDGLYVEVGISRFRQVGQRAFRSPSPSAQTFRLNIPLTATITPFEITGGYRFHSLRHPSVIPYLGAGIGWYAYTETSSVSDPGENVDTRHVGELLVGGVEFRVQRWVGLGFDAHYTHIPGILGTGGLSKDASENDLGGVAARFRLIVGR
jgi:hypothetical protein